MKEYIRTAWPPKASVPTSLLPYYNVRSELSIDHECVVRCDKHFVIPASLHCRILHIVHEGHPGIVRAELSLRATYWWPSLDTHVENFIRYCPACQDSAKAHKPIAMPHITIPKPTEPWHKIRLDICGPFSTAPRHQRFVTTVIDHALGYPEVLLSNGITSSKIINSYRRNSLISSLRETFNNNTLRFAIHSKTAW